MNTTSQKCPKCNGRMLRGYIPDANHACTMLIGWVQGSANKSWIGGIKRRKGVVPVGAFRCEACGYLEFYARAEFAAE
jgi:hypothetical protein